jgi:amino acid transporter
VLDYILTVAVSISSATAALLAAFPALLDYRVVVALVGIAIVTVINLRGSSESSRIVGIPTYVFIAVMALLIVVGLAEHFAGLLQPIAYTYVAAPATDALVSGMLALLLLRAFAAGCTALTGIEAVSNSVSAFHQPRQRNARIVLYCLAAIVLFIFGGSVVLAQILQVLPVEGQTVISQMGAAVFGLDSPLFFVLQLATVLILFLAANTAYSDLPNLLADLARDTYMPRQFLQRGTKLSFSNGIMFIFVAASALVIFFRAQVHLLIPLYSVGVFASFSISQAGMVVKWIRDKEPAWKLKIVINVVGAIVTTVALIIVFVMKFSGGAWMLAVAIPLIMLITWRVHVHYQQVKKGVFISKKEFQARYRKSETSDSFLCVVPVAGLDRSTLKMLNYANMISCNVVALNIAFDEKSERKLRRVWEKYEIDDPLDIVLTPFRNVVPPIEDYLEEREAAMHSGEQIVIVLTKFVVKNWYDQMLHNQTTYQLTRALQNHRNVSIMLVPYHYTDK